MKTLLLHFFISLPSFSRLIPHSLLSRINGYIAVLLSPFCSSCSFTPSPLCPPFRCPSSSSLSLVRTLSISHSVRCSMQLETDHTPFSRSMSGITHSPPSDKDTKKKKKRLDRSAEKNEQMRIRDRVEEGAAEAKE